jgi:REP element-mobilizing transposase RayT
MTEPIYTAENCSVAYQLDWSYSLFWKEAPDGTEWFGDLRDSCEADGIRILNHQLAETTSQFLISTRPNLAPIQIAQRVKGRLQHLIRLSRPKAFRRNYSLRSVGSTRRERLDKYLANQLDHHPTADPRVAARLARYQIHHPEIDLSSPQRTTHALYWYNLHIVLVHAERYAEIREDYLSRTRDMIDRVAMVKRHRLSRAAIVLDHIHLTMGCDLEESPQDVVLAYMNNLAYAHGMCPLFRYSYYVGTFSEYDLGVIPRP